MHLFFCFFSLISRFFRKKYLAEIILLARVKKYEIYLSVTEKVRAIRRYASCVISDAKKIVNDPTRGHDGEVGWDTSSLL